MEATERLKKLSERLGKWRKATPKRSRLPEEFWEEAVEVARECGVYRTAKSLPVDWRQLRKRMGPPASKPLSTKFVEVKLTAEPARCVVERATKTGARTRVELAGWTAGQVAELVKALEG